MVSGARFAGWTAVAGAVIGLLITPFMAAVWAYQPGVVWDDLSWLAKTVGPTLESWGALSFGHAKVLAADGSVLSESFAYEVYGKAFFLVYLLMIPIVRYVHLRHQAATESKAERRVWRVMWISLIVATAGDAISYWGISLPGELGDTLWGAGFGIEILAALVLLPSVTAYGIVIFRLRVIPRWAAALLVGVIPIGILTLVTITTYVPNALIVPLSLIWAAIGIWTVVDVKADADLPATATP